MSNKKETRRELTAHLWDCVRDWYVKKYPEDAKLGSQFVDCTFADVLAKPWMVYDILGVGDSMSRERVFEEIARISGVPYETIYDAFLDMNGEFSRVA